jgi:hypothetical protein
MPKKPAPAAKPQTHFEQVPVEVVAKVASLDTPLRASSTAVEPDVPRTPASPEKKQ